MLIKEKEIRKNKVSLIIIAVSLFVLVGFIIFWTVVNRNNIDEDSLISKVFSLGGVGSRKITFKLDADLLQRRDFIMLDDSSLLSNLEIGQFGKQDPFAKFPELEDEIIKE